MAEFGVTPAGFIRKRLADIRPEIIAALRNNLQAAGLSGDIETRPDSVMGILIDTFAEREAALWELSEGIYGATYPSSASGVNLDNAVSLTGAERESATPSRGYVVLYGEGGTVVPAGSRIRSAVSGEQWGLAQEGRITRSNTADATVSLSGPPVAQAYTVYIDGVGYTYNAAAGATEAQILNGLAMAITDSTVATSVDGAQLRLIAADGTGFPLGFTPNLRVGILGSPALAETLQPSTLGADPGTLTVIDTAVAGWASVNNPSPAAAGAPAESDSSLRNRYGKGLYRMGGATLPAIAARVRADAAGVTNVVAYENTSDYADMAGRPPHSVHVIVEGGLDLEIAEAIRDSKAAGIATHGAFAVPVETASGLQAVIRFDRPVPVYVWIKASITLLDPQEQAFPDAGLNDIAAGLAAFGGQLSIGDDVVWQSFYRPVYGVPGVAYATLLFATSSSPAVQPAPGAYQAENITIQPQQRAMFDPSRIEVT
ncbi:baseplate J/gp47 family protein [Stenotrophomonas maltophilia]|uniref:baseplate J/gp47 family protein n=1 Tax=Stenotrophomonas maltophilia TaxID=40324 RepID=UPI0006AC72AF|nr:baseplate J/gp47 family protein [Stenotrophomonas maltophilia]KOQ69993.1 hypothetical protein ABW43_07665 [Stenotrophomonas maltophilia]